MTIFTNPFRTIRDLRATVARQAQRLQDTRVLYDAQVSALADEHARNAVTIQRLYNEVGTAYADLEQADQGLFTSIDERTELVAGLALTEEVVLGLTDELFAAHTSALESDTLFQVGAEAIQFLSDKVELTEARQQHAENATIFFSGELATALEEGNTQAQEIVQIVGYVKAAEAELASYGIEIVDGPAGPQVRFTSATLPNGAVSPSGAPALLN
jgi:hypothetical protein